MKYICRNIDHVEALWCTDISYLSSCLASGCRSSSQLSTLLTCLYDQCPFSFLFSFQMNRVDADCLHKGWHLPLGYSCLARPQLHVCDTFNNLLKLDFSAIECEYFLYICLWPFSPLLVIFVLSIFFACSIMFSFSLFCWDRNGDGRKFLLLLLYWLIGGSYPKYHLWYGSVAAETKKGFISVTDKKDGYSFLYPFGWQVWVSGLFCILECNF